MRNIISLLLFSFFTVVANAQQSVFPPLGIDSEVPRRGDPGSAAYSRGEEGGARTKARWGLDPMNKDATRFLEKAVAENNVANAAKFLQAGASAYISYEMIDKKQYEMIDVMYKDNPKLIRFSQLLHYACAKSDPKMIDFLIERNASLDLYGYYLKYGNNGAIWGYFPIYAWNSDANYKNTPADVALFHNRWENLNHIMNKYQKYPTIYGCCIFLASCFWEKGKKPEYNNLKTARDFISGNDGKFQFMNNVNYTITDIINFGYHYRKGVNAHSDYLVSSTIQKIADSRKAKDGKDKEYIDFLNLLFEKGASPNPQDDNGAAWRAQRSLGINNISSYVNTTPMYIAVTNPNMLDIVKLLRSKGASMKTTANGETVSIAKLPNVLDEYKEYFILEGIQ